MREREREREREGRERVRESRLDNGTLKANFRKGALVISKIKTKKFYGQYGDLVEQYDGSLSRMLNYILLPDIVQWRPTTKPWPYYRTRPFTELWEVSIEHLERMWHADRGRLHFQTPGPVPLRTCICSTCWDQSFSDLVVIFSDYAFRKFLGTFSICFDPLKS